MQAHHPEARLGRLLMKSVLRIHRDPGWPVLLLRLLLLLLGPPRAPEHPGIRVPLDPSSHSRWVGLSTSACGKPCPRLSRSLWMILSSSAPIGSPEVVFP